VKKKVISFLESKAKKNIVLEKPKAKELGHYATPIAFALSKELKKNPLIVAEELSLEFEDSLFEKVEPIKGFINFKLSRDFLNTYATKAIKEGRDFGKGEGGEKILLEFVSANPTGPLHIGHARGAINGDALLKIGRHLGFDITSEYYINDAGNQIDLLGLSIFLAGQESILKKAVEYPEQYYRGEYIIEIAFEAEKSFGSAVFDDKSNIPILSEFGKNLMLEEIKSNLKELNIVFDNYVSEKSLFDRWDSARGALEANGALYEKDGKIWLASMLHGDEKDRVVVREDGVPTYLAGDIIYHRDKFSRGFDRYINIWGADHHGYIARVKSAIKHLGYDETTLEVILSQMVSLLKGGEPYKMSKRAGNFILLKDVVEDIGADALRFVFLSKKSDTHLEFDVADLNKEDQSNPIYYINYAHARIHNMFEKSGATLEEILESDLQHINEDGIDLLFEALILPEILETAFEQRSVNKVAEYLKSLAASLHRFYNEHRVIGASHQNSYLKVLLTVANTIDTALHLLGIEAKKRM